MTDRLAEAESVIAELAALLEAMDRQQVWDDKIVKQAVMVEGDHPPEDVTAAVRMARANAEAVRKATMRAGLALLLYRRHHPEPVQAG